MRILLAFTEINQKFGSQQFQHGLGAISAFLKANGRTDISLAHVTSMAPELWQQELKDKQPDLIGFYSVAPQFPFVGQLINQVPKDIFTLVGGPHTTCFPGCIDQVKRLDAICVGEGEYPILELCDALERGQDPSSIESLWVRQNGNIVRNPSRPFISDLSALPHEDRRIFNAQKAIDQYGFAQLRMQAGRGCPFMCTYCSNKNLRKAQPGRYVRFRSVDHILDEIKEAQSWLKFTEIVFDDDIFMLNRDLVMEFCERYEKEVGLPFNFAGRVEACKPDILNALSKAGARRIDFGVEAGNEELRRTVLKRKMSNNKIREAAKMAKDAGLQIKTLNMVGLPEETKEMHQETVALNRDIDPDVVSIFVFLPYPGTEAYDYCVEKGYVESEYDIPEGFVSMRDSVLKMPQFSKKSIDRCFRWFGYKVFIKRSIIKAFGYKVIYSRYGDYLISITGRVRKFLRKFLKGF